MAPNINPTAKALVQNRPAWVSDPEEADRVAAYRLYEDIYWTVNETFKLVQRGSDTEPIYIPTGRTIVETLHRYLANDMSIQVDPEFGSDTEKALATQVMNDLVRRERFYSKFSANKRFGIIRGDWLFHIYADGDREPGAKISIYPVDPGSYFPIYNPDNIDEVIGCHIVEPITDAENNVTIRRLTYRKATGTGGPSPITVEVADYELEAWGGPGQDEENVVQVIRTPETLPSPIDHLPIYHIPHFDEPNVLYGSSEMRGLERIMGAVNQGISDEELTLALDGLGCYATDAGAPIDPDTGLDLPWNLGPGRVVEVPSGAFFNRVSGASSVSPFQDHLKYLHEQIDAAAGTPAVAKGTVDVTTAESGVALIIQMGPMLSKAVEKEQVVTDVMANMMYDLSKWYIAYEGTAFNSLLETTRWMPTYGSKIPVNRKQSFQEIMDMVNANILPMQAAWDKIRELGIDLPDNGTLESTLIQEKQAFAQLEMDAIANRLDQEMGGNADEL